MRGKRVILAGLVSGLVAACSGDSTGNSIPNIVGTWRATKFEFVSVANAATRIDLIAAGGTGTVVISSNGSFSTTLTAPGSSPIVSTGTYVETATTLTVTITNPPPTQVLNFTMAVSGSAMVLSGAQTTFDFGSGSVTAYVNINLTRQ